MALTCGFFNSIDNDRLYDAADFSTYLKGVVGNGCFTSAGLKVLPNPDPIGSNPPSVIISEGKAFYDGMWINNDAPLVFSLGSAQQIQSGRYHLVYLCFDTTDLGREVTIEWLVSTNSAVNVPANADGKYYLPLARVADQMSVQPVEANITDIRYVGGVQNPFGPGEIHLQNMNDDTKGSNVSNATEALRAIGLLSHQASAGNHNHDGCYNPPVYYWAGESGYPATWGAPGWLTYDITTGVVKTNGYVIPYGPSGFKIPNDGVYLVTAEFDTIIPTALQTQAMTLGVGAYEYHANGGSHFAASTYSYKRAGDTEISIQAIGVLYMMSDNVPQGGQNNTLQLRLYSSNAMTIDNCNLRLSMIRLPIVPNP